MSNVINLDAYRPGRWLKKVEAGDKEACEHFEWLMDLADGLDDLFDEATDTLGIEAGHEEVFAAMDAIHERGEELTAETVEREYRQRREATS